jgi:hypothetical protein
MKSTSERKKVEQIIHQKERLVNMDWGKESDKNGISCASPEIIEQAVDKL